ncbi:30S ribosomal protein S9 [Candidatus Pacearchaeota archaeon]|nr:30S ribosomal protein S9 [Candidatus Pacearchaeota archaeon]
MKIEKKTIITGKRKTAIARALIKNGTGKITVNSKPIEIFPLFQRLSLQEPAILAEKILGNKAKEYDIEVKVIGGGQEGQVEAARLAIARCFINETKSAELKKEYIQYDRMLLIADTRRKEQRKPNDSRARAARQKSYR